MVDQPVLLAHSVQTLRYVVSALFTIHIVDWILLFPEELELIHYARWNSVKVAYLFCRYYPFLAWSFYLWAILGSHSPPVCAIIVHAMYALLIPMLVSVQTVVLLRAIAFLSWRRQWHILLILVFSYFALFAVEIWLFTAYVSSASQLLQPVVGNTECVRSMHYKQIKVSFHIGMVILSIFLFDLLCTSVVVANCLTARYRQNRLGKALLAQSLSAFFAMLAVNIFATVEYMRPLCDVCGLGMQFTLILGNVIACRLVLHFRRSARPTQSHLLKEQSRMIRVALANLDTTGRHSASREGIDNHTEMNHEH